MSTEKTEGTPAHLFEPYDARRKRHAAERKMTIARERAKLAATYAALKLPVPPSLSLEPQESEAAFIPYRIVRGEPKPTGHGRPPSAARAAAKAAGRPTYWGGKCKRGHNGLRRTASADCVECAKLAQKARKAINHADRGRARPPQMARNRVRGRPGYLDARRTRKTAPRPSETFH